MHTRWLDSDGLGDHLDANQWQDGQQGGGEKFGLSSPAPRSHFPLAAIAARDPLNVRRQVLDDYRQVDERRAWADVLCGEDDRAAARRAGHPSAAAVPVSVAAAMLGITRQGVHDLIRRRKLDRDEDGVVTTASVQARLSRSPRR